MPAAQLDALFEAWLYGAELPALPQPATAGGGRRRWLRMTRQ